MYCKDWPEVAQRTRGHLREPVGTGRNAKRDQLSRLRGRRGPRRRSALAGGPAPLRHTDRHTAQIDRYISDVTRTYRGGQSKDGFFRHLYSLVLGVEEREIARCTAGA